MIYWCPYRGPFRFFFLEQFYCPGGEEITRDCIITKFLQMVRSKLNGNLGIISQHCWCFQVSLRRIAYGKWGNNYGQACIAPDYLLVDESIASEVVSHFFIE